MSWRDRAVFEPQQPGGVSARPSSASVVATPPQARPPVSPDAYELNPANTALQSAAGTVMPFKDELAGGLGANLNAMFEAPGRIAQAVSEGNMAPIRKGVEDYLHDYRFFRDRTRAVDAAGERENPTAALVGTAAGVGLGLAAPVPTFASAPAGAGLRTRALYSAANAAPVGAVFGLGASNADLTQGNVAGAAGDTALSAGLGGAVGAAGEGVASGVRALAPAVKKFALDRALAAIGTMKRDRQLLAKKFTPQQLIDFLYGRKIVTPGASLEKIGERLGAEEAAAGAEIGALMSKFDEGRQALAAAPPTTSPRLVPQPPVPADRAVTQVLDDASLRQLGAPAAAGPTRRLRPSTSAAAEQTQPLNVTRQGAAPPTPMQQPYQRDEQLLEAAAFSRLTPQERDEALLRAMAGPSTPRQATPLPAPGGGERLAQDEEALRALGFDALTPAQQQEALLAANVAGARLPTMTSRALPTPAPAAIATTPSPQAAAEPDSSQLVRDYFAERGIQYGPERAAAMGDITQRLEVPMLRGQDLQAALRAEAGSLRGQPGLQGPRRTLERFAKDIEAGPLDLQRAGQIKRSFDPLAGFNSTDPSLQAAAAVRARGLIREKIDEHLLQLAEMGDSIGLSKADVQALRDANVRYGLASQLEHANFARQAGWGANRTFSFTDTMAALAGLARQGAPGITWGLLNHLTRAMGPSTLGYGANKLSTRLPSVRATGRTAANVGRVSQLNADEEQ